jgi:hypothetical protein
LSLKYRKTIANLHKTIGKEALKYRPIIAHTMLISNKENGYTFAVEIIFKT